MTKTTEQLILPTGYLSATQISMWQDDPAAYFARYFRGEPAPESPAKALGRRLAGILEQLHDTGDSPEDTTEREHEVLAQLTYLDVAERKLVQDIATGVTLVGYLDTSREDWREVIDYKTGATPWTMERVKASTQLKMYAFMVYELTGINPDVGVDWMQTKQVKGTSIVELTGQVKKFRHKFSNQELYDFKLQVIDVARDISRHYAAYQNRLPGFQRDLLRRYEASRRILEEAKKRHDELRDEYVKNLETAGIRRVETEGGTFYTATRKSYEYPEGIVAREAELKALKKQAEQTGDATCTEKVIFQYRAKKDNQ